jgi:hypothetical protein
MLFKQFSGSFTGQQSPATFTLTAPSSVTATFVQPQPQITFNTNPPGLLISVDGANYPTPVTFAWGTNETHAVGGPPQPITPASQTSQYAFSSWADSATAPSPRNFSGSLTPATYTVNFGTQYLVSTQVTPGMSGTVTGGGWYNAGSTATLQETPAAGFNFSSFSGSVSSTQTSLQVPVNGPVQETATYTAARPPILYASSSGRTENADGTVTVPIVLANLAGGGPAGDATITGVSVMGVPTGGGTPVIQSPALPYIVGTLFPGQNGQTTLTVLWPTSATRATFHVTFTANNGAYSGSTNISLFR